jgi:hypothetical protein
MLQVIERILLRTAVLFASSCRTRWMRARLVNLSRVLADERDHFIDYTKSRG